MGKLSIQQAGDSVEPSPAETEPSAGAYLLASEAQDEIAVTELLERESGIHELEVAVSLPMGIVECFPYSHCTGIQPGVSLAHAP